MHEPTTYLINDILFFIIYDCTLMLWQFIYYTPEEIIKKLQCMANKEITVTRIN